MSPKKKAAAEQPIATEDLASNLGQVREILFGNQVREIDVRFAKLEARVAKDIDGMRSDVKKRLESLDLFVKKELDSLTTKAKAEQKERKAQAKDAAKELRQASAALEKQLGRLEDRLGKTERDLTEHVLDQITSVRDDLAERATALEGLLEKEVAEARSAATDRAALASLLQEMALRLTDGLDLPDLG